MIKEKWKELARDGWLFTKALAVLGFYALMLVLWIYVFAFLTHLVLYGHGLGCPK